jgi:hypothetical protein
MHAIAREAWTTRDFRLEGGPWLRDFLQALDR